MLYGKHALTFWVAIYLQYTNPTKELDESEPILRNGGKRIVTSPLLTSRQLHFLKNMLRDRDDNFKRNLWGMMIEDIINTELKTVEYIPLACLKFTQLSTLLAKE